MGRGATSKYRLADIPVGEIRRFYSLAPGEHDKIKRSAHNYNRRTNLYFTTKFRDGVVYVARLR